MLKKLIAASTILGVAALLQNKERRERVMRGAKELLQGARAKVGQIESKAKEAASSISVTDQTSAERPFRSSY